MIFLIKSLQFIYRIIFFAPPGIALACMRFGGWLTYSIAKRTNFKKHIAENIKIILPDSEIKEISDQLIKNLSHFIFELICLPYFNKKHFKRIFKWENLKNLEQALGENKGAILLSMHAGNYEAVPAALGDLDYKVNSILRATEEPIFKILNFCRSHKNVNIINVAEQDMYRETLKILNRNEIIGTLADTGALEGRHQFMHFLGKNVPVATGWLTLAQRSEAPVVITLTRKQGKKNIISLYKPFTVTKDNRDEIMQSSIKVFEDYVKQYPDQWGIFLNSYEVKRMVEGK